MDERQRAIEDAQTIFRLACMIFEVDPAVVRSGYRVRHAVMVRQAFAIAARKLTRASWAQMAMVSREDLSARRCKSLHTSLIDAERRGERRIKARDLVFTAGVKRLEEFARRSLSTALTPIPPTPVTTAT